MNQEPRSKIKSVWEIDPPYWIKPLLPNKRLLSVPSFSPTIKFNPHRIQIRFFNSTARFTIVHAGRRSGKSEIASRRLVLRMMMLPPNNHEKMFFVIAPTHEQVKLIYWDKLKSLFPSVILNGSPNETELVIRLVNGAVVKLFGLDKPFRFEGKSYVGGIVDEFGNLKPEAWDNNIRPALENTRGYVDILGVPERGGMHYKRLFEHALTEDPKVWAAYSWHSSSVLPPDLIAAARRELDPETFRREYQGEFIAGSNLAYHAFSESNIYNDPPMLNTVVPLDISFDFNVEPSVCVVGQTFDDDHTYIIDEVVLPKYGNTLKLAATFADKYSKYGVSKINVHGDLTGYSRHTSQTEGNDYDIIENVIRHKMPNTELVMPQRGANPREQNRVITLNSRLCNHMGVRRLFVSKNCKYLIKDLENVQIDQDGALNKKYSKELTHISDALGYMVYDKYGHKVNEHRSGDHNFTTFLV